MSPHERLALVVALAILGYAIRAYFWPYHRCPRCRGTGTNPGSSGRRWGKCRRCKGSRQVKTLGARFLHRAVRSAVRYSRNRKGN